MSGTVGSFSSFLARITVSAGFPAMISFSFRNLRKCRIEASLRALVVPVLRRPASRFINSTISNRCNFLGLFQSALIDWRNSTNCVMSALYALIDSLEKLFPESAFRKMSCPCSSVMSSIVRLLYSISALLQIPKTAIMISSDNHLFFRPRSRCRPRVAPPHASGVRARAWPPGLQGVGLAPTPRGGPTL